MTPMQQEATQIIGFSPSSLWVFLGVAVGLGIIALIVFDLILKLRELRKPKAMDEKTIQDKLKSDHDRLSKLEDTTKRQDEELRLVLRSQMAMIHHMIDGNGVDGLRDTQRDIENYLITGKMNENGG